MQDKKIYTLRYDFYGSDHLHHHISHIPARSLSRLCLSSSALLLVLPPCQCHSTQHAPISAHHRRQPWRLSRSGPVRCWGLGLPQLEQQDSELVASRISDIGGRASASASAADASTATALVAPGPGGQAPTTNIHHHHILMLVVADSRLLFQGIIHEHT
jgi:hypothetical protein